MYKLFVGGYLLRVVGSVFFYLMTCSHPRFPGFLIADSWVYSANAAMIAERLRHGLPVIGAPRSELWSQSGGIHYYDYLNGGIYFLLGKSPLIMFFLNSFFGILAPVFIYFITLTVSNRNAARLAAALCAFWPSLFLWSTQNLKEPLTIACIVLCLWAFVFFLKRPNPCYPAAVFFLLRFLAVFRPPLDKVVLASLVLHVVFLGAYLLRKRPFLIFLAVLFFVLASDRLIPASGWQPEMIKDPKSIISSVVQMTYNLRSARATAGLAFLPGYEIAGLKNLLQYLPIGVSMVLFAPFPWQVFSPSQIMALPEMLAWYFMLPYLFSGAYFCASKRPAAAFSILAYTVLMVLLLAFIEGNIGTMFRHRSLALVFFLMFIAIGIHTKGEGKAQYASV